MGKWLTITVLFCCVEVCIGQQLTNKRCKKIQASQGMIQLDTLTVDPASIVTDGSFDFHYDVNTGSIQFNDTQSDQVEVCYRVFPLNFSDEYATHTLEEYDSTVASRPIEVQTTYYKPEREQIFQVEGIQKTGSISRGVSFGNNQNAIINSSLNLQLDGKLADDLNIRAAITDQNIPFQPEGNTQQLQDFDNVYIQLYNDNFSLTGGDVVLRNKESNFLRYYKNVQGGQAEIKYNVGNGIEGSSSAAFAVAKGRFASTQVDPIEGVSGPYKLRGPDNERFIIVLANSEKVFLDGKLLKRGYNQDYIIDYNLAELTFNNHIIITKFSRIRVDFEFSDRNYNRSIIETSHALQSGKSDLYLNFYQEKDNENRPLAYDLSLEDRMLLNSIGDNTEAAVISGADSVGFNENLVLYKQIDTLDLSGAVQSIFKFSVNPDSARFNVSFSDVGFGNGDYVLVSGSTNGRIYRWVSPQNGQPQGSYAPVTQISTPSSKQMFTVGGGYKITESDRIYTELAFSNHDANLFSSLGNEDNQGYAVKVGYEKSPVDLGMLPGYKISGHANLEYDNENFRAIDRFRSIEFNRNWGISNNSTLLSPDNIMNAGIRVEEDQNNRIDYRISGRIRGEEVNGTQHWIDGSKRLGRIQLNSELFILNNDQEVQRSEWKRWVGEAAYHTKIFVPGYRYTSDRNQVFAVANDSIFATAMNFNEHQVFLRNSDTLKTRFNLNYALREDRLPLEGELVENNRAQTANLSVGSTIKDNHNIDITFTYRDLENLRVENTEDRNDRTIQGRLDWAGSFVDDHIRNELTYAINNSRELRREFIFLQVNTGEGTHTWRDLNGDGIQDLSEFFEAINPDERNYVKIFVPTDEFIEAFSNLFNYRFSAKMPRSWRNEGGIKSLLGRLSNVTTINLDKKITDDDVGARFFPFSNNVNDEDLIAIRQNIRSTFFFNRANPGYAMDFGVNLSEGKQLLTNGIESRNNEEYNLNLRYNLNRNYNFTIRMLTGQKSNFSDFLEGRNFIIDTRRIGPEVAWQPSNQFRLSTGYVFTNRQNIFSENQGEHISTNEYRVEMKWAKASKSSVNAIFRYIDNDFEGDENSALGYELLNALRPGKNTTWSLNAQRKLGNGLRLNVNYEGRKSPEQKVIHLGRMQVTALF